MHSYTTLCLMLLTFGAIASAGVVFAMAMALLRPPRMTDGKALWVLRRMSPGDLGLEFASVQFNIRDPQTDRPMRLAGWWMGNAAANGRCVVLLHGYADGKVGAIAWAPLWHMLGFNVLAIDLRAHGYSDGLYCTAGFWERHDLSLVLDQLIAERPAETRRLVLFGVSLGAATASATAVLRNDIAAVVLESPPADFAISAMVHMDRLGAPGKAFQLLAISLAQRIAGCDFSGVQPVKLIPQISCPVMIVAPNDDPMVGDEQRESIRQSLHSRNRERDDLYWTVSTGHMLALHAEMEEYEKRLRTFLATVESAATQASG